MREHTHTPGPWHLSDDVISGEVIGCRNILDSIGGGIACTDGLEDDDEDMANARLIAAAPAMLEANKVSLMALCMLLEHVRNANAVKDIEFAIEANRAAIARATGVLPRTGPRRGER